MTYYRTEPSSRSHDGMLQNSIWASVATWLMVLHILGGLASLWFAASATEHLTMQSERVFQHGEIWRLLTGIFVGPDVFASLWAAAFVGVLGRSVETSYGSLNFLILYLVCGVVAGLMWSASSLLVVAPSLSPCWKSRLATSAAPTAVVTLFCLESIEGEQRPWFVFSPTAWLCFVIYLVGVLWSVADEFALLIPTHLASLLIALVVWQFDLRWSSLVGKLGRRAVRTKPKSVIKKAARTNAAEELPPLSEEEFNKKLDAILEKISKLGSECLTKADRRILFEASRRYQQRKT